jgi:hypothetical protein
MKCEICNAIERLGLDPSAHDLWFCCGIEPAPVRHSLRVTLEQFAVKAAVLHRIVADVLVERCRQVLDIGIHHLPSYRQHYTTLGL